MTAPLSGLDTTKIVQDLLYETGVVYIGATPIGVTVGGIKWNPGKSYLQPGFDGKQAPFEQMDRVQYGESTISFMMQELGDSTTGNQIEFLEPGATAATVATVETITPKAGGGFVAAGDYATNVRVMIERGSQGSGKYLAILFPKALCTKYDVATQPGKEGQVSVEFSARLPLASAVNVAPYQIEYRTDIPAA